MNPPEAYEITLATQGAVALLEIKGEMTAFSEPFLNDAYRQANDQKTDKILLNFDRDAYIDSAGLAVLIQIIAQTKKRNQLIGITGLSDHFVKIFNMVGITKFAKIHNTVETAMEALNA